MTAESARVARWTSAAVLADPLRSTGAADPRWSPWPVGCAGRGAVRHRPTETRFLEHRRAQLAVLGPAATLARGYAVVQVGGPGGRVLRIPQDAPAGTALRIRFADGAVLATLRRPRRGRDARTRDHGHRRAQRTDDGSRQPDAAGSRTATIDRDRPMTQRAARDRPWSARGPQRRLGRQLRAGQRRTCRGRRRAGGRRAQPGRVVAALGARRGTRRGCAPRSSTGARARVEAALAAAEAAAGQRRTEQDTGELRRSPTGSDPAGATARRTSAHGAAKRRAAGPRCR